MSTWHLNVSTRFAAELDEVWRLKTDLSTFNAEMGLLSLKIDDADGLQRAVREGHTGSFDAKLTGPLGLIGVPWPLSVEDVHPGESFQDTSSNLLFSMFHHVHRIEQASQGKVRYVDTVTFTPALGPSKLVAILVKDFFVRRHQRFAKQVPAIPRATGVAMLRRMKEEEAAEYDPAASDGAAGSYEEHDDA